MLPLHKQSWKMSSPELRVDDSTSHINHVGVFSTSWKVHLELLHVVLQHLSGNDLTIRALKCE